MTGLRHPGLVGALGFVGGLRPDTAKMGILGRDSRTIVAVDLTAQAVTAQVTLDASPLAAVVDASGKLIVLCSDASIRRFSWPALVYVDTLATTCDPARPVIVATAAGFLTHGPARCQIQRFVAGGTAPVSGLRVPLADLQLGHVAADAGGVATVWLLDGSASIGVLAVGPLGFLWNGVFDVGATDPLAVTADPDGGFSYLLADRQAHGAALHVGVADGLPVLPTVVDRTQADNRLLSILGVTGGYDYGTLINAGLFDETVIPWWFPVTDLPPQDAGEFGLAVQNGPGLMWLAESPIPLPPTMANAATAVLDAGTGYFMGYKPLVVECGSYLFCYANESPTKPRLIRATKSPFALDTMGAAGANGRSLIGLVSDGLTYLVRSFTNTTYMARIAAATQIETALVSSGPLAGGNPGILYLGGGIFAWAQIGIGTPVFIFYNSATNVETTVALPAAWRDAIYHYWYRPADNYIYGTANDTSGIPVLTTFKINAATYAVTTLPLASPPGAFGTPAGDDGPVVYSPAADKAFMSSGTGLFKYDHATGALTSWAVVANTNGRRKCFNPYSGTGVMTVIVDTVTPERWVFVDPITETIIGFTDPTYPFGMTAIGCPMAASNGKYYVQAFRNGVDLWLLRYDATP